MNTPSAAGPAVRGGRIAGIDRARGIAILLMVAYHAAWDLDYLGLAELRLDAPFWHGLRLLILTLFIGLVGVSLSLARARGLGLRHFLRRVALIAGGAVLVSLASILTFPESAITFGVLHCIALSSVLALPFLRLPTPALLLAGAATLALAPLSSPFFDTSWLDWLGFATNPPAARDHVPLIPWFGVVLLGVAAGRQLAPSPGGGSAGLAARLLARAGRNSLAIYLLHQPLLYGLLLAAALALGRGPASTGDFAQAFLDSCRQSCAASGVPAETCAAQCRCVLDGLGGRIDASGLRPGEPGPEAAARLDALAQSCAKSHLRQQE